MLDDEDIGVLHWCRANLEHELAWVQKQIPQVRHMLDVDDLDALEACRTRLTQELAWIQEHCTAAEMLQPGVEFRTAISGLQHLTDEIERIKRASGE